MSKKNVTLRIDEDIYDNYKEYCDRNGLSISVSVEKFMSRTKKKGSVF